MIIKVKSHANITSYETYLVISKKVHIRALIELLSVVVISRFFYGIRSISIQSLLITV